MNIPTVADVLAARKAIAGTARRTPLITSALSEQVGQDICLKLETLQPTGAFKLRGATNAIAALSDEQKANGVVCCSTGNHGRAVAFAAKQLGVQATVCLSKLVPMVKVKGIEALGAEVVRIGDSQDDAGAEAERLVKEKGMTNIHPFDDRNVIAGQGTIALELLEERPDLDTLIVPLSGGGLISGIALAAKAIKPDIRIVGVSMDRGAAMAASLVAGKPIEVEEVASLADSLGGGIGLHNRYTFPICRELVDEVRLLTEQEIYTGMQALYRMDQLVAEGASAVGHAAILSGKVQITGPTALIITGRNVDMQQFSAVIAGDAVKLGDVIVSGKDKVAVDA